MSGSFQDWHKVLEEAYRLAQIITLPFLTIFRQKSAHWWMRGLNRATKPGGYLEFQDYSSQPYLSDGTKLDGNMHEHPIAVYAHHINQAFEKSGRPLDIASQVEQLFIDAGFVDVEVKTAIWPIGRWPKDKRLKEIGTFGRLGSEQSLYPFGISILTQQGWTEKQVSDICDKIKHSYALGDRKGDTSAPKYYFQAWVSCIRSGLVYEVCLC